jgi:hypothetical protein
MHGWLGDQVKFVKVVIKEAMKLSRSKLSGGVNKQTMTKSIVGENLHWIRWYGLLLAMSW